MSAPHRLRLKKFHWGSSVLVLLGMGLCLLSFSGPVAGQEAFPDGATGMEATSCVIYDSCYHSTSSACAQRLNYGSSVGNSFAPANGFCAVWRSGQNEGQPCGSALVDSSSPCQ